MRLPAGGGSLQRTPLCVLRRFHLQRGVSDLEMFVQLFLRRAKYGRRVDGCLAQDEVGRERNLRRAYGPDVQVMDAVDSRKAEQKS